MQKFFYILGSPIGFILCIVGVLLGFIYFIYLMIKGEYIFDDKFSRAVYFFLAIIFPYFIFVVITNPEIIISFNENLYFFHIISLHFSIALEFFFIASLFKPSTKNGRMFTIFGYILGGIIAFLRGYWVIYVTHPELKANEFVMFSVDFMKLIFIASVIPSVALLFQLMRGRYNKPTD